MPDSSRAGVLRYHSLDALRASMMLLGVVRHAAINYDPTVVEGWPYKDARTDILAHWAIALIRVFQLPVFFLIAGFFAGYLVEAHGVRAFLRNRWSRIGVPLLVAWPVLAISIYFSISAAIEFSSIPASYDPAEAVMSDLAADHLLMHLWFLYYLIILSVAATAARNLAHRIPEALRKRALDLFERHLHGGSLVVAVLVGGIILHQMDSWTIDYDGRLVPAPRLLATHGLFFAFGWLLFLRRNALGGFKRRAWLMLAGGMACFIVHRYIRDIGCRPDSDLACTGSSWPHHLGAVAFLSLSMWQLCYGLVGVFLRYASHRSPRWRYMADASYWIYLVHVPVVMLVPIPLADLPLPAMVKLALVVAASTGLILLAYHCFVRPTFIGRQLNGFRHPRRPNRRASLE